MIGLKEGGHIMQYFLNRLLRSNFRCGRMLYSRTVDVAGRFGVPTVHRDIHG